MSQSIIEQGGGWGWGQGQGWGGWGSAATAWTSLSWTISWGYFLHVCLVHAPPSSAVKGVQLKVFDELQGGVQFVL